MLKNPPKRDQPLKQQANTKIEIIIEEKIEIWLGKKVERVHRVTIQKGQQRSASRQHTTRAALRTRLREGRKFMSLEAMENCAAPPPVYYLEEERLNALFMVTAPASGRRGIQEPAPAFLACSCVGRRRDWSGPCLSFLCFVILLCSTIVVCGDLARRLEFSWAAVPQSSVPLPPLAWTSRTHQRGNRMDTNKPLPPSCLVREHLELLLFFFFSLWILKFCYVSLTHNIDICGFYYFFLLFFVNV